MKVFHLITAVLLLITLGCTQSDHKINSGSISHNEAVTQPDTSNRLIYDFMHMVIFDQKLNLRNGIRIVPEHGCDPSGDDGKLFNDLLIKKKKSNPELTDGNFEEGKYILTYTVPSFEECLSQADIDTMFLQKDSLFSFTWDNSRLGFDTSNHTDWYTFSVPIFSLDQSKAVMRIENLCPGLCGSGWTVLFKKENNKWTSKTGSQWLH